MACAPTINISPRNEKLIRTLALALPLPIMAYAVLSSAVQTWHPADGALFNTSVFYVDCERFLFGTKRADDRLNALAEHFYQQDNFPLAQRYAQLAVENLVEAPNVMFGSAESYKKRLVDRLDLLARVYERQGKNSDALRTWQRKHTAIHQLPWTRRMKLMCAMTLAKEAYNWQMLGMNGRADRLYRRAERLIPEADCEQADLVTPGTHDCSKHRKTMPVFCNHARMVLEAVPTNYATRMFSEQTNRYNPKLQSQQVSNSNSYIMVPVAEYDRMKLGLLPLVTF